MIRAPGDGEPIMGQGVWLAVEDAAEDADGVVRVMIERITGAERQRFPACDLQVTDTIEERVANILMSEEEGEAR